MADSAIDFARSSVTWLLPEQPSRGRFSIDAALTVGGETFYLCAQVFAGHVYGDGPLFQDPPYEFSAAFSTTRYRIFRDSVRGAGRDDSFGEHEARFKSIDIDIVRQACGPVPPGKELHAVVARVRTADAELEFPVRHVNSRADGRFQIETGPVLMLEEGEGGPLERLRRAYVHLGRLDCAQFLLDAPRGTGPGERWSRRLELRCALELLRDEA